MHEGLVFSLAPECLDEGSPEECAAFGILTVRSGQQILTEGHDHFFGALRSGPLISGYHLAEWLAWNWWKLRWEPYRSEAQAPEWWRAHDMAAIGEGYLWPNIRIHSDGVRTVVLSRRSQDPDCKPFRYLGAHPVVLPSTQWEAAVDAFIPHVLARLDSHGVPSSNLHTTWEEVCAERLDPNRSLVRRYEALLGIEPDEAEDIVLQLVDDATYMGSAAMAEVAADHRPGAPPVTAADLRDLASRKGFCGNRNDAARLPRLPDQVASPDVPAWKIGKDIARRLRKQEDLGDEEVDDRTLCALAGVTQDILNRERGDGHSMSFALSEDHETRFVLRSRWHEGRRFELARLISEHILHEHEALAAATQSSTYRQKLQRAFATELLAPFEEVMLRLDGDHSEESRKTVAEMFGVSEHTIRSELFNHRVLDRDGPDAFLDDFAA